MEIVGVVRSVSDGIAYRYGKAVDRVIGDRKLLIYNYKKEQDICLAPIS